MADPRLSPDANAAIDAVFEEHPHAQEVTVTPDARGHTVTARVGVGRHVTVRVPETPSFH